LPENVNGFGLSMLLYPEEFLEALLKFQTSGSDSGTMENHTFSIVWPASTKQSLKILMDMDWPY